MQRDLYNLYEKGFLSSSKGWRGGLLEDEQISSLRFANDVVLLDPSCQDLSHALGFHK